MAGPIQKRNSSESTASSIANVFAGSSLKSRVARFVGLLGGVSSLDTILGRFDINAIALAGFTYWLFFSTLFNVFLLSEIFFFPEHRTKNDSGDANDEEDEIRVFHFILPTDGIKPFYNLLIEGTSRCLESASDRAWLLCPRIPTTSFDKLDIWQSYEEATIIRKATGGIFLLADDPDANYTKIVSRIEETNIPLVMIDVYFDVKRYDARLQARMPHFVGGDENAGGRLAAEILYSNYVNSKRKVEGTPKVLMIKGGNTAWELQRLDSFKATLSQSMKPDFIETNFLFYHREDTFDAIYHLFSAMSRDEIKQFVGIFSANDDMAMGARSALREINRLKRIPVNVPIVGYDGTPEVKRMIDRNDEFIIGTVDVRLDEQAKRAVYVMKNIIDKTPMAERVQLISPKIYIRPS